MASRGTTPMALIVFEPFNESDGPLWLEPGAIRRITKAPNRRTAARIIFWADGREEFFDTSSTPAEAAGKANSATGWNEGG